MNRTKCDLPSTHLTCPYPNMQGVKHQPLNLNFHSLVSCLSASRTSLTLDHNPSHQTEALP